MFCNAFQMKELMDSPRSSLDGDDLFSDPGDPIHDADLLQELFYKNPESDDDMELSDVEDVKTSSKLPAKNDTLRKSASLSSLTETGNMV